MPNALTSGIRKILADQGLDFAGSDDDLTVALGSLGRKELEERFPDFAEEFRAIREANSPGTLTGIANSGKNAFDRSRRALSAVGGIGDGAAENISEAERRIQSRPVSVPWEDWSKSEGTDALKVFARDPIEIISNIVVSGFAGSVPAMAGGLTAGAAAGAAGGPAAPITAPVGAAIGTGAGSLAVEYGNKYLDVLREAGADLSDPESIKRVVADQAVQEKARELGLRRGIPVAAFDAISAGLAGKFLKGVRTATVTQNVRRGLSEAAVQGALGGGGEVAGALSAGEAVSPRAVFEEVVGELGPGAVEVGGAAMRRKMAERGLTPNAPAPASPVIPVNPLPIPGTPTVAENATVQPAVSPARRVALMTDEEKAARFAELSGKTGQLMGDEAVELELLRALVSAPDRPENVTTLEAPDQPVKVGTAEPVVAPEPIAEKGFLAPAPVGVLSEPLTAEVSAPVGTEQPSAAAPTPPATPNFATATSEAIDAWEEAVRSFDKNADVAVFGEEQAKVYRRLQRTANGSDNARADAASAKIAQMEEGLSPAQQDILFGRSLPEGFVDVETAKSLRNTAIEIDAAENAVDLARAASRIIQSTLRASADGQTLSPRESEMAQRVFQRAQQLKVSPQELVRASFTHRSAIEGDDVFELAGVTPDQLATFLQGAGVPATEAPALAPAPALIEPPVVPELTDVPPAPQPSPSLEDRLRQELKKPEPFAFGTINEGSGVTVDLRDDARFENLTPEMANRLPVANALDESGNRAKTRVAVVLEAPDGRYIKAGLLVPQQMGKVGGAGARESGPGVQSMAVERRAGGYQKVLKEGGNRPALLADVIAAGYKLRAVVHFDTAPGSIFQRFANREAFDASYAATKRTNASSAAAKVVPTASASEGAERKSILTRRDAMQREIDTLGAELERADPARAAEINDEIQQLYAELGKLPEPRMATEPAPAGWDAVAPNEQPTLPAEADRADQFALVTARIRQSGAKVDVFARTFLQAQLTADYQQRLDALIASYQTAPESKQAALQRQIELTQERLGAMDRVRGVAYSPTHIAMGLEDVQAANLADLVTLIHEAGHMILKSDPAMQARVLRAVNAMEADLRRENIERTERTGAGEAKIADAEELLVQTLGQRLAEEGVPEAPSLARAIVQWVKDLYFRLAMAVQSAFGAQPDPSLALDWFENQLRRLTGGDFDYRFADIFNRFVAPGTAEQAQAIGANEGTPAGMADFYNPIGAKIEQPEAEPTTVENVNWNLRFATDAAPAEKEIPYREAKARIMGGAINEEAALADRMFAEMKPADMTFDAFWETAGRGDAPKIRVAELEQQVKDAGTAQIGGERMTEPMNQQARVQAKRLLQKWQWKNIRRIAADTERSAKAEASLVEQAKLVNKIEGDLRNAEMHEATLRDKLKEMVRGLAKGMRRGLDTAFAAGELAEAVREAEQLAERDPIPTEYQNVFRAIIADQVPVFEYLSAIAKLDMPLHEMTRAEIIAGIRDNAAADVSLARLTEPRNKPLLVALTALAKKNAEQMDLIQLRAVKDPERYLAIKAELDAIRNASEQQLKAIAQSQRDGKKAITFADRIKRSYVEKRAKLRRMQATIQEAEARRDLLTRVNVYIKEKLTEMEASGIAAPSEWTPAEGATWTAMQQDEDGGWKAVERTLRFSPDGPAVDADKVRSDLAQNRQWLAAHEAKAGSKLYETVKRQTLELQALDLQQRYPEGWRHMLDKLLQPLGQAFAAAGGAGARVQQMLNNFQFIQKSYWHGDLETLSLQWTAALRKVEQVTGIKDHGSFFSQIYDPVLYYIQTEPGLEEGPALREAVRAARRRLPTEPSENFDETFKDFMRRTKAISERYVAIAEQHGAFVKDPRLGGELRRAVAQGWLTVMRRVNSSVVAALTREMQGAGWTLRMEDDGKGGQKVARATTFDALMPDGSENDAAKVAVLEDPNQLATAIDPLFTPNIVRTWLTPFLNKPGEPLFRYQGEQIDQMDVQKAWEAAGGNVVAFIDTLGAKIGLTIPEQNEDSEAIPVESMMSPEAEFRASMLRQIDRLFAMESRIAAEAAQTKNLFDPMGPKPHVVMDARINELIPPEHLQHVTFDPISARNLLATLAFHGAFGRNGERMTRTLDELKSKLTLRKNEFDSLSGTTEAARKAEAAARGIEYAAAKRGARSYRDVLGLQESLKGMFAFNQQAGVLGDMRTGLEVLHFITGQTVNNPKTAFLNMLQPAQRALVQRSLGVEQIAATGVAYAEMAKQVLGSILENFGLHVMRASEHARDIGAIEGQGYGQLPWSVIMSDIGKGGRFQDSAADSWVIRPLRMVGAAQRKGVRVGMGESKDFARLNVIPGVGGVMNYMSQVAATSNGVAEVWALERVVKAGMDYLAAHPEKASDPAFRFTATDLGMKNRWWFDDEGTFEFYRRKTVEYGVGNLEDIVRGAMERTAKGEQLLTREQALRTAMLANNELDLQSSINTRPAGWATNPILKFGLPLLGWPLAQMNQVHQALKTADGRASWKAALKGLGILAAWSLPMGLAFTLMTDEYDDKILKRKSNLTGIDPEAAIPLIGPALALATGERGMDNVKGMLERMSKAGNIYGVGADAVAQTLNSIDPTSGQRPFSLDQRVLVFSQFLNLQQALSNWINQGGTATWASVERPFIMAIGGNGALHAVDVFNGVLGLDNAESRMVQRTNAQQWLRAAGREAGLELRRGGGSAVAPTPVSVWLREMQFAAYANDRLAFLDSYRRAIDAAREEGKPNPEQSVLDGWKARDPLDVFKTKPNDFEMAKAMSVMSDNGRQAVRDALRLYEQYSALIAPSQAEIYQRRQLGQIRRGPADLQRLRRQMAGDDESEARKTLRR